MSQLSQMILAQKLMSYFFVKSLLTGLLISTIACQPVEIETYLVIRTDMVQYNEDLSYSFYGNLTGLGEHKISEHGFCWSESINPDIYGSLSKLGPCTSSGDFTCTVSGLSASTTYYVRAYIVVDHIPQYGDEISFTTRLDPENTVMDVDGNLYKTVQIGDQTWMAQNLNVSRYSDEVSIPHIKDQYIWYNFSEESKAYCYYDNLQTNAYWYGALYTWAAAVRGPEGSDMIPSGIQGVCPDGWHLPSDGEWKQLEISLGMTPEEADNNEWRGEGIGDKMKRVGIQWWACPDSLANNSSGFDALPGGYRHGSAEFLDVQTTARFWSSTNTGYAWFRELDCDNSAIYRSSAGKYRGHSVRCIKDK